MLLTEAKMPLYGDGNNCNSPAHFPIFSTARNDEKDPLNLLGNHLLACQRLARRSIGMRTRNPWPSSYCGETPGDHVFLLSFFLQNLAFEFSIAFHPRFWVVWKPLLQGLQWTEDWRLASRKNLAKRWEDILGLPSNEGYLISLFPV